MAFSSENTGVGDKSAAKSDALGARKGAVPPELAAIVEAWDTLPDATKKALLEGVNREKSAGGE